MARPVGEDVEMQRIVGNRYRLRSRIGAGGMAEVFLARDLFLEREVAIKVLHASLFSDAGACERFRREGVALASVRSRHVLEILDIGTAGGEMFLVLQYVPGRNAAQLVGEQGALPLERGAHLVTQVLDGLAALHEQRLVHRDVNPANVIVGWDDHVVLIDLGVVLDPRRPSITPAATTAGTAEFMAPEQWVARGVDHRTDLYQTGLLFLAMLTGVDVSSIHNGVTDEIAELLTRVPSPIAAVIRCALSASPVERFSCAVAMRIAIERAVAACARIDEPAAESTETDDAEEPTLTVSRTITARERPLRVDDAAASDQRKASDVSSPPAGVSALANRALSGTS
jgi:serine/threonine protein kinase